MSKIIENLRQNKEYGVDLTNITCPICGSDLYYVYEKLTNVCGEKSIFHCENNIEHKFWHHTDKKPNILYGYDAIYEYSKNSYHIEGGYWNICKQSK